MKRRPLAIHAVPRSSTVYHTKILRKAGFNVGHNYVDLDGTVSHWIALPGPYPVCPMDMATKKNPNPFTTHIGEAIDEWNFTTEIHMVRHPLSVIGSIRGGVLPTTLWTWFATHVPECRPKDPMIVRGMLMWLRYNAAIEALGDRIHARLRIEDEDELIWKLCMGALFKGEEMAVPKVSKTTNRMSVLWLQRKETGWDDLDEASSVLSDEIRALAGRYGYGESP